LGEPVAIRELLLAHLDQLQVGRLELFYALVQRVGGLGRLGQFLFEEVGLFGVAAVLEGQAGFTALVVFKGLLQDGKFSDFCH
jgi:hypothetical protein